MDVPTVLEMTARVVESYARARIAGLPQSFPCSPCLLSSNAGHLRASTPEPDASGFRGSGPGGTGFLFRRIVPWPRNPIQVPDRQFYRLLGVIAGVRRFMRGVGNLHATRGRMTPKALVMWTLVARDGAPRSIPSAR